MGDLNVELCAFEGFSMTEQGAVRGRKLTFHLKQFLRRTFDIGSTGVDLDIRDVIFRLIQQSYIAV